MRVIRFFTMAATLIAGSALAVPTALEVSAQPGSDVVVDDFEDGNADGWFSDNYESVTAVTDPTSPSGGQWVGKVEIAYQCNGPSRSFGDPVSPDFFRYYFRSDGDTGHASGSGVALWGSTSLMTTVSYHLGELRYRAGLSAWPSIMPAALQTWYLVELRNIDWAADTFDIWVDGALKIAAAAFYGDVDSVSYVQAYACPPGPNGPLYLDDISYGYDNLAPIADPNGPYVGPVTGVALDGSASSDPEGDSLTYFWDFGDSTSGTGVTPIHAYAAAGIYDMCLTVNDGSVDSTEVCTYAVVFDPSAGFVTGGGWFDSPPGAYHPTECVDCDPGPTGKATFGFVSKYKKGAFVPDGTTEFQFMAGDLNFHSSSYDWLVVTGADFAKFKGTGAINGAGEYKFMIWAGDGSPDTFRIKIWDDDGGDVIYDNGVDQPLGGGSIVIHTKK